MPIEGNPDSSARVIYHEDLQCGDCRKLREMLDALLLPKYGDRVAFESRDFPLEKHDWARPAAIAARYFDGFPAGLGVKFRRQTLAKRKLITPETFENHLMEFAVVNGQNPTAALTALSDAKLAAGVEVDRQEALRRGVAKTPTVFIGDESFIETFTSDELAAAIERAIPKPVAIVTGASRGIGRGIAIELAKTHHVVATYRGRLDAAESLRAETGCEIIQSDVSSPEDRASLIEFTREKFGRLDLLVNNAGIAQRVRADVVEATAESFDELISVNLKGPHFLTQLAARWMLEQGCGRIAFVTSISSYAASINRAEYCISKAGLSMSVAVWANRLAPHRIQVFEIRPGVIRTDMISSVEAMYEKRIADGLLPQRRMGESADVARVVRAIADGHLDYSAGQVLNVDGGFHLRSL